MDKEEWQAQMELMKMTREELENVEFDLKKWRCQCENCTRGTRIRDYGISPNYYWPAHKKWVNLNLTWLYCAKHWKFYKRLIKNFPNDHADFKLPGLQPHSD